MRDTYSNVPVEGGVYDEVPVSINEINRRRHLAPAEGPTTTTIEDRPYCRALYDFQSETEGELSFSAGDILYLTRRVNTEWLEGEAQASGATGIFPAGFVEVVEGLKGEADGDELGAQELGVGVASVLHDFNARFGDELSVASGDSVRVLRILDDNWVECCDVASGRSGILPQEYLQIFLDADDRAPTPTMAPATTPSSISETSPFPQMKREGDVPWSCDVYKWGSGDAPPAVPPPTLPSAQQHPPLPSLQPFNVFDMDFLASMNEPMKPGGGGGAISRAPPPRPPPPSSSLGGSGSSLRQRMPPAAAPPLAGGKEKSKSRNGMLPAAASTADGKREVMEQKGKIIQDLLSTEIAYLNDLNLWEMNINVSAIDEDTKRILTNGYPMLKSLSQRLIDGILNEREKSEERRYYGEMLMEMRELFFRTYAQHCRCVEQSNQIVEGADAALMDELGSCLTRMRSQGSNLFDVPSAVSRPIHRCLKYPLYVGELLKNTPINHPDHPKLLESLRQLGNLALKMNECKRRKELIKKYRDEQQLSLLQRLQRINVHSLVKKSNRLKYRITSNLGMGTVKDCEFDYLISLLDGAERRLCKFLYCAQIYKRNLELTFKRHEESYKGLCQSQQDETNVRAFASMFRAVDKIYKNYVRFFEENVINEGKQLVRCEFTKLIHKRCDKLADYETAKAKNADDVEMRRNEYEALNNQVKNSLPRVISAINKKVVYLVGKTHELDEKLLNRMDEWFANERPERVRQLTPLARDFRYFLALGQKQRFLEMDRILRAQSASMSVDERFTLRSSTKHKKSGIAAARKMSEVRAQSMKERDALVKMMKAQGKVLSLRRVAKDYHSNAFVVRAGDVVVVTECKFGSCVCDNGLATADVPMDCLAQFDDNYSFYSPPIRISEREEEAVVGHGQIAGGKRVDTREPKDKGECFDLIDLSSPEMPAPMSLFPTSSMFDRSPSGAEVLKLIDYDSEPKSARFSLQLESPPVGVGAPQFPPASAHNTPIMDWPLSNDSSIVPYHSSAAMTTLQTRSSSVPADKAQQPDPFAELFRSSINMPLSKVSRRQESPAPEIPTRPNNSATTTIMGGEGIAATHKAAILPTPAIPVRTAPLPPLPKLLEPARTPATMPTHSPGSNNRGVLYLCAYDFTPANTSDTNQLSVREGEQLELQQRHDDAGNSEWWLVKKVGGNDATMSGYVPASYLTPLGADTT